MTKPIDPFSLNGKPVVKGAVKGQETAEEILRRLREKAGRLTPREDRTGDGDTGNGQATMDGRGFPETSPPAAMSAKGAKGAIGAPGTTPAARAHAANGAHAPAPAGMPASGPVSAEEVDSLMMAGDAGTSPRSHLPVLAAVFLVSAIAGGTLAGMIFSSRLAPVTGVETGRDSHAQATARTVNASMPGAAARANETVITPRTMAFRSASGSDRAAFRNSVRNPQADRSRSAPAPQPEGRVRMAGGSDGGHGRKEKIVKDETRILPAGETTGTAGSRNRLAKSRVPASSLSGSAPGTAADPARPLPAVRALPAASDTVGATPALPPGGEAPTAGDDELKALTDNVVAALTDLTQAGEAATERQTGNVREALSALVERALAEGRSEEDVARLLAQALGAGGKAAAPAALRDASGRVDLRLLLASIVPTEAAHRASGSEQDYVNQLVAEGERTVVLEEGRGTAAKGRFYFRNGKRYTRIRPGDTLSRIAFEAYGDVLAYPVILRANAGRISIRRLKPGMEIEVPLRKDAAVRGRGPVRLAPKARAATRRTARKDRRGTATRDTTRKAAAARTQTGKAPDVSTRPATEARQAPRKFTNFRSRFTGTPATPDEPR